jgi:predicted small secreted protein
MRPRHALLPALLVLCSVASAAAEGPPPKPLALHPDNPHYFLFRGKPALLISSAEHYGAVLNLDFDYGLYLKELADKGLNQTRCFSGVYREVPGSFSIKDNTLAPQPDRYSSPWADAGAGTGTGGSDKGGGRKYDLTKWNDAHFKRMRDYVRAAGESGVVVELVLFCPFYEDVLWDICPLSAKNNVNGVGKDVKDRKDVNTLKHKDVLAAQEALTRKVVTELKEFDNV